MAIPLKTEEQIMRMRDAGRVVRQVLNRLGELVAPGVTTEDLDAEATQLCRQSGAECLFRGVPGRRGAGPFPGAICASLNEQVVHGIPSASRTICEGDIVSVDFGVRLNGWCGDAAETYLVGDVPQATRHLVEVTRNALAMAIEMVGPGKKWSDAARAMQNYVEGEGFAVVRDFVGHGIGAEMHEEPKVPNFVSRSLEVHDIVLEPGMVLAIEPMVNAGTAEVQCLPDGWTMVTRDGKASAHFEHTVAVTANGVDVLTDGR